MMRRKLGILILAGITVLAGTQEARRQFDGLRSTVNDLTRASLWSGLIVYAQPVSDGTLPAPQIYYLTPQTQTSPAAPQQAVLADNSAAAAKPETKNNHAAEELATLTNADALPSLPLAREIEDAAKSELVLDKMASHVDRLASPSIVARLAAAPKLDKVRVFEEVASNVSAARKFKRDADVIARVFVKEFDNAKLEAEITRIAAAQEQIENSKLKAFAEAENSKRFEFKLLRRSALPRPERPARLKVIAPYMDKHAIALPEISSIGCETKKNAEEAASAANVETRVETVVETTVAAAGLATSVVIASEPLVAVEVSAPAAAVFAPLQSSTSWALGCDMEPEFAK